MSNELLRWRRESSNEDWEALAALAKTSVGYLDQIAYGFRRASPDKASHIETASKQFDKYQPVTKENLVFAAARSSAA
ncbi:antirepressor [bacteria symbiont BFo1 of Frankliniella occidentalis]|nr:antirepressor [bacteria symbiont BFo1 of Frankliniella occidentalis]KYP85887.1 antirepressor [bacteria symbiont BFo1 of Frankliniella occidentalis]